MLVMRDKRKRSRFLKALVSEKMIEMLREKGFKETEKMAGDLFEEAITDS